MLAIFAIAGLVFVAVSFATWSRPAVLGFTGNTDHWQTARGVLFGLWTLVSALSGVISKRNYTSSDRSGSFLFVLSCDLQLVLGLVLYFANSWFDRLKHLGDNMKDANNRFFTMEHALMMMIAWILVHVGSVSVKRTTLPISKHKRSLLFFGLAILIILAAIPWPFREAIARPLYRWFN